MSMEEQRNILRQVVLAGIFAALVFVITYFVKIPVPQVSRGAYINLGDTAIYIVASLINPVFAMFAAGFGSALADVAYGGGIYIPATLFIKGLMGFAAATIARKGKFGAYILSCVVGGLIMLLGYGIFEIGFFTLLRMRSGIDFSNAFVFGLSSALGSSLFNLIQFAGGVALALPFYTVLPRIKKAGRF